MDRPTVAVSLLAGWSCLKAIVNDDCFPAGGQYTLLQLSERLLHAPVERRQVRVCEHRIRRVARQRRLHEAAERNWTVVKEYQLL